MSLENPIGDMSFEKVPSAKGPEVVVDNNGTTEEDLARKEAGEKARAELESFLNQDEKGPEQEAA